MDNIQIGPFSYKVSFSELELFKNADSGEKLFGMVSHEKQTIYLQPTHASDIKTDSLLHEVLHCCWFSAGLTDSNDEETIVRSLSTVLLDTLRRNEHLVKALIEGI